MWTFTTAWPNSLTTHRPPMLGFDVNESSFHQRWTEVRSTNLRLKMSWRCHVMSRCMKCHGSLALPKSKGVFKIFRWVEFRGHLNRFLQDRRNTNMQGITSKPSWSGNIGASCFTMKMLESGDVATVWQPHMLCSGWISQMVMMAHEGFM